MEQQIMRAVQYALDSSRKVEITFRDEAIKEPLKEIVPLFVMRLCGLVSIHSGDEWVLMDIIDNRNWGCQENRTVAVTLTDKFTDGSLFVKRMIRAIEKIKVIQ